MEFKIETREVESVGAISTKKITLSPNAKAFKIIFGQIYPDIIKAIVRELFTNAWDSQKSAGTLDTAIDIHLPTKWEPYFSIRDYGTGMSPEQIDNVYSRVFESSKDNSNDEAGMFGMGSKTPLGYVDTFGIVSSVNGYFWAYDMFINNDGEPIMALKAQGETDLPNGVEVTVGVNAGDEDTFKKYAEVFALNSGAAVNINRQRVINNRVPMMNGDGWLLNEPCDDTLMIRMGCVLYRIDSEMLTRDFDRTRAHEFKKFCNFPIIIDFDIGDFDVTGSREDIVYNSESIAKLEGKIYQVIQDITSRVESDINLSTTKEIAYQKYFDYKQMGIIVNEYKCGYKSWTIHRMKTILSRHKIHRSAICQVSFSTKKFKPSHVFYMSELYGKSKKLTYIVLDPEKPRQRTLDRLHHLRRISGSANILWIKGNKLPARTRAILPSNYIVVNIMDIDVPKVERQSYEKKDYDACYKLRTNDDDNIRATSYQTEFVKDGYYVLIGRNRRPEKSEDDISIAAKMLGVKLSEVNAILESKIDLAAKYNLKDLLVEGAKARKNYDYNEPTYQYFAIREAITTQFLRWRVSRYTKETLPLINSTIVKLMGWDINTKKVDGDFESGINSNVTKKFKQVTKQVVDRMGKLYEDHVLLKYIPQNVLGDEEDSEEIMREIGEIK